MTGMVLSTNHVGNYLSLGISLQVHVMGEEARQRFDLEALWGLNDVCGEDEDMSLIPPPREGSS